MRLLFLIAFVVSLIFGQFGSLSIQNATIYLHDFFLVILIIFTVFTSKNKYDPNFLSKYFLPQFLWICIAGFSLVVNGFRLTLDQTVVSSFYLVRWVLYASLPLIMISLGIKNNLWFKSLYFFGFMIGIVGLFQFILYPDLRNLWYLGWDPHYYRLFSTLLDPNFVGIILVLTFLLGIYLFALDKKFLILQGLVFLAIILTYSRASYLSLILGLLFGIILLKKITKVWLLSIFGVIILIIIFPKPAGEGGQLFRTASVLARIGNYQKSIGIIQSSPVFGLGFNTLRYSIKDDNLNSKIPSKAAAGLDNSILFLITTSGIFGLGVYLIMILNLTKLSFNSRVDINFRNLYLSSYIVALTHSLFNNTLFYPWVMIWLWILNGVMFRKIIHGDK